MTAAIVAVVLTTVGAIVTATGIGTGIQSAKAQRFDEDFGHGQFFHDSNGDVHSNGHS